MSLTLVLAANAVTATILGITVAFVAWRVRRPELLHVLWLAVLLDLLTPPLLPVRFLPDAWFGQPDTLVAPVIAIARDALPLPAPAGWGPGLSTVVSLVWVAGSVVVLGLAIRRGMMLSRALAGPAGASEPGLDRTLARLCARFGIARLPRLRVVSGRISPLVRPRLSGVEILVPRGLLALLDERETTTILAHELAHVGRLDPWVRLVELAATVVFWWHPLVYIARAALRRAEEACCDDRVVSVLPGHAVAYARALVKTLEFLSPAERPAPVWVTGAAHAPSIERRLTMILDNAPRTRLPRAARFGVAVAVLSALAVFPVAGVGAGSRDDDAARAKERAERDAQRAAREADETSRERELERALAETGEARGIAGRAAREQDLARIELERALAETAEARGIAGRAAREQDLARIELERALAETAGPSGIAGRAAREQDLARIELERALAAERHAVPESGRSIELERVNEELRHELDELSRRVRELERRLAERPEIE